MKDEQLSWLVTVLFHLAVLILMMSYTINFAPIPIIENIEIIAFDDFQLTDIMPKKAEEVIIDANIKDFEASEIIEKSEPKIIENIASTIINLPSSTENYETAVKVHDLPLKREKSINYKLFESQVDDDLLTRDGNVGISQPTVIQEIVHATNTLDSRISDGSMGYLDGVSISPIEGDARNRQVLRKELPKYPDNMQKDGIVRLQFTVLQDGSVGDIKIVKKSDPIFETLAIQALNKWKFNRSSRRNTGIIGFHFKIE
ncbi:MAG: TonB family protein [Candidatus Cloacimonadales bacterium]|jgi:TonB family protein|nr:energy transducer TonB [Candidatus Cloacimonadota bacterium]MDD2650181.1 TonB family protein [Candidatus Cloacimonadota bacterium]MDX9976964.1 TonB family protein [Candidatus Cloacimonadales bacterium]